MCSNVVKPLASFQHFLRKSLWCTHQKEFFLSVWLLRRRICTQILWKHHVTLFSNFSQNSTYLLSIFLWNRHVSLTNFQRIVNVLWVLLSRFRTENYRCFCFFPCLFWNQVSSVLSPPSLLSFTWWTVVSWKSLKLQQRKLTPSKHMAWVCSLVAMRQILFDQREKLYNFIRAFGV